MAAIDFSKILVAPKATKLTLDMNRYRFTRKEARQFYIDAGLDPDRIISSHERQLESIALFKRVFAPEQFVSRSEITRDLVASAPAVIALGGDNHFTFVTSFCNGTPILSFNSDERSSVGQMCPFRPSELQTVIEHLSIGEYTVENWCRLEVLKNGRSLGPVTSEVYIGEREATAASRMTVKKGLEGWTHTGSGMLFYPGAGSTGWALAMQSVLDEEGNIVRLRKPFEPTDKRGQYTFGAPYSGRPLVDGEYKDVVRGVINPGETIAVFSHNDSEGVVEIDPRSDRVHSFRPGEKVEIRIAEAPLRFITIG